MSGQGGGTVSPGPPGPWSPFPVQDWSQLPDPQPPYSQPAYPQPLYPQPPEVPWLTAEVDPSWGPPVPATTNAGAPPARSWWPPLLILVLVVALVGGALWVADRGTGGDDTAAQSYLPADGGVSFTDVSTTRAQAVVRQRVAVESARLVGPSALLSTDSTFGTKLLGALGTTVPAGQQFWRTTTTDTDAASASQQTVAFYRVDGAVELLGVSGFGVARLFSPGLVELPADVSAGATWTGSGTSGELRYRAESRAEAADGECLRVLTTITLQTVTGQQAERRSTEKTWCPGRGITTWTERRADVITTAVSVATPAAASDLRTTTETYDWSDPGRWRPRTIDATSIDVNFGEDVMAGVPGTAAPVLAASGLLIRPSATDDLVAFTPKTPTSWTSVWRMHPGGRILSLAAFGDVVVATTSLRQAVAYTDAGVRLWSLDLDDVAFQAPVRTSGTEVALVEVSGELRVLELRTGRQRWRTSVGAEVNTAPVAGGDVVVVLDGSGLTQAFATADGSLRWTADLDATRAVVSGDLVVVQDTVTLTAVSLSDGRYRWRNALPATAVDLQAFGGDLVLASRLGTTVFGSDGAVRDRWPAYRALTVNDDHLVGWGNEQAEVRDRSGEVVATWDTPDATNADGPVRTVTDRFGIWRFTPTWTMLGWTDQP